ncbi:MAG: hypothetical protein D6743_15995 [Calditrichaeota bacterium]|nr:MAG: hypothetical protein D6743_15995 [Calditrichota bacterium]
MKPEEILQGLESLLESLSVEVRYEKGNFTGGYYRYKDKRQMVLNKDLNVEKKIGLLATELKTNLDVDSFYVVPALREVIENAGCLG